MWRINVANVGIGTTGLRPSCEPANAAQAMNSAARILHLQPAILLRGVEKQFPAQCDCPHRPERAFAGCKKEGLLAGELFGKVLFDGPAQPPVVDAQLFDARPSQRALDAAARGFDLGQFGHRGTAPI